ncbi:MAG: tetratricopeptide repeat protein [Deltaproteobacteria bacterium]|nr:tetratricopeptide repeat protein [Deltaproteobacteria bacterium]
MLLSAMLALLLQSDPMADLGRSRELVAAGDMVGAAQQLKKLTNAFPTWGLAQVELAEVLLRTGGDDPTLEKVLVDARALEPLNPRVWLFSGRFFELKGEPSRAIEAYERATQLRPDLVDAHERLGALQASAGHLGPAVAHLRVVVEARPEDRTARANLAEAHERQGELEEAERHWRSLADSAPQNVAYRRRLVDFYDRLGESEKAAAEVKKLDAKRPSRRLRPLQPSR